jgi:hypothetical protein
MTILNKKPIKTNFRSLMKIHFAIENEVITNITSNKLGLKTLCRLAIKVVF